MSYILYFSLVTIIFLVFVICKHNKINTLITLVLTLIIIFFILNPKGIIASSKNGAILFFNSVFPTLFPFLVVTDILIQYGGINIYSKIFGPILCKPLRLPKESSLTLIVSSLCGYPLGAKYACSLYEENQISFSSLKRLLNIASNVSPLFIMGTIASSMLNIPKVGYILLSVSYLSCLVMAIILPADSANYNSCNYSSINHNKSFGAALKEALDRSLGTSLSVGTFIIIFSVFTYIIEKLSIFNIFISILSRILNLPRDAVKGFTFGLLEMTNGCNILAHCNISMALKVSLISFLCSFSGLCIIFQVYSFVYKIKDISISRYIFRKFLQGIISFILTYAALSFIPIEVPASSISAYRNFSFIIPSIVLITLTFISIKLKNLLHIS